MFLIDKKPSDQIWLRLFEQEGKKLFHLMMAYFHFQIGNIGVVSNKSKTALAFLSVCWRKSGYFRLGRTLS
jgi:hypothetical protein